MARSKSAKPLPIAEAVALISAGSTLEQAAAQLGCDVAQLRGVPALRDALASRNTAGLSAASEATLGALPTVAAALRDRLAALASQTAQISTELAKIPINSKEYAKLNEQLKIVDAAFSSYLTKYDKFLTLSLEHSRFDTIDNSDNDLSDKLTELLE